MLHRKILKGGVMASAAVLVAVGAGGCTTAQDGTATKASPSAAASLTPATGLSSLSPCSACGAVWQVRQVSCPLRKQRDCKSA
mgnify:CR=1 FL=1